MITREDYDHFRDRNSYLAAKLLTVFVEHPVIVLGYSAGDEDVARILTEVARLMTRANLPHLKGKLIFVRWIQQSSHQP